MVTFLVIATWAMLLGSLWGLWTLSRRIHGIDTAPVRPTPEAYDDSPIRHRLTELADDIETLAERIRNQNVAIAEGIERTDRAERRVRSAVNRARSRMEALGYADESIDAEAEGLRELDGAAGNGERLSAVLEDVEPNQQDITKFLPGRWS